MSLAAGLAQQQSDHPGSSQPPSNPADVTFHKMKSLLGAVIALRVVVKLVKGCIREPVTLTKTYRIKLTPDVFVAIGMDKHVSQLVWSA